MYDLNILPIHLRQGRNLPDPNGIQAFAPPRRTARGREEDVLILSLNFSDPAALSADLVQGWTEHLSHTFFKTSGTVTAALRSLIETLNLTLLERNLKTASEGISVTCAVNLAVIRRRSLYIAQAGQTHAFVLSHQGLEQHADSSGADRGLGVSRTPAIRYYQDDLGPGAYYFTTPTPQDAWQDSLLVSDHYPSMDQLRRRLLNQAPSEFDLGLVQLLPGEGKINLIRPMARGTKPAQPETPEQDAPRRDVRPEPEQEKVAVPIPAEPEDQPAQDEQPPQGNEADQPEPVEEAPRRESRRETVERPSAQVPSQAAPPAAAAPRSPLSHLRSETEVDAAQARTARDRGANPAARQAANQRKVDFEEKGLKGIAAALKWWRNAKMAVNTFFRDLVAHWSPEGSEGTPALSKSSMIFIAIAVPLVVVAISVGVYLGRGRSQQYEYYYQQAEQLVQAAVVLEDPVAARETWNQALMMVGQAESYRATDETVLLRDQVQDALDLLDGAVRLDYRPALIGTLYDGIEITRIVSVGADLYLLDKAGGRVIHAESRTQGFEVDADFVCAAGNFESGSIGDLVDMVALPINNPYLAHVLAVDAQGNAAYCGAGMDPIVVRLPQAANGAGEIRAITYAGSMLYALSPTSSSVQLYYASNGQFNDAPVDFFAGVDYADIPDLSLVADLAVNGDMLYLLNTDGSLVACEANALGSSPVACENPVAYVDGRVGMEDQPVTMPASAFNEAIFTSPPDQTISVLDSSNGDIYQFSVTFRLHQRLRPSLGSYEVEDPTATAFSIGIDRVAFLAFGHQLFYAYLGQ